jgi:hypothetical protein
MSMHPTLRRLAVAAGLSALGAALVAGPAAARTAVFRDAHGDIAHGADIWRVRVVNEGQVRIKVVHRNLRRAYTSGSSVAIFLDTDRARRGPEFLFVGGTFEGADYTLLRAKGWKRASDRPVRLHGGSFDMRLDYRRDTALVRIDRVVLGNPGAVRVEVKTGGEHPARDGEPARTEVDWLGAPRQFSPWVRRG